MCDDRVERELPGVGARNFSPGEELFSVGERLDRLFGNAGGALADVGQAILEVSLNEPFTSPALAPGGGSATKSLACNRAFAARNDSQDDSRGRVLEGERTVREWRPIGSLKRTRPAERFIDGPYMKEGHACLRE